MPVAATTRFLVAVVIGAVAAGCDAAEVGDQLVLECDLTVIVLQIGEETAELSGRLGELTVTDREYQMRFPAADDAHWEVRVVVDRHTARFKWEHGREPFGALFSDNVRRSGTCEVREEQF